MPVGKAPKMPVMWPQVPVVGVPQEEDEEKRRGLLGKLRDPRVTAFLLNMAHSLSQPRQWGQTGAAHWLQSLMHGYSGVALATELARQRAIEQQKLAMEMQKAAAEAARTRAEAGKIAAETGVIEPRAQAEAEERKARAEQLRAEAGAIPERVALEKQKFGLERQKHEAELKKWAKQVQTEEQKLNLEVNKLNELIRSNMAMEEIEREKLKRLGAFRASLGRYYDALANEAAMRIKLGGRLREVKANMLARIFSTIVNAQSTFNLFPDAETQEGLFKKAQEITENIFKDLAEDMPDIFGEDAGGDIEITTKTRTPVQTGASAGTPTQTQISVSAQAQAPARAGTPAQQRPYPTRIDVTAGGRRATLDLAKIEERLLQVQREGRRKLLEAVMDSMNLSPSDRERILEIGKAAGWFD